MDYLNNLINYIINELPDKIGAWFFNAGVSLFTWINNLPVWVKYLVLGVCIVISILIIIAVIKTRDNWRIVY